MSLVININDLLNKQKIESNRIEFKKGWNPDKIYQSICAFANDRDNIGGGYILVGVEEERGVAKRPIKGVPRERLDEIQKAMVGFNNKINPFYLPHVEIEEVDGQCVLVIWVPTGAYRPYSVPESVTQKQSPSKLYVRAGSSSVEAKGEVLDYLKRVNSKLADDFLNKPLMDILDQMDLLVGPTENRWIKNVAVMMFCENPAKFFPTTQIDIVHFPEGVEENPDNMIEVPKIVGPVPYMIKSALNYLRTNVVKERIIKPKDREESIRYYNFPYQAFEEAVANAMYHRDYQEREPVEITIEPDRVTILSYSGPDRSISMEAIKAAKRLKSRRYRNRRLGDFLKELELTEGRGTGIPTIQKVLLNNGSAPATIETDEERSYFLLEIPCRDGFEGQDDPINDPISDPINDPINGLEITPRQRKILEIIRNNPCLAVLEMSELLGVSQKTAKRDMNKLVESGIIQHVGSNKSGCWEIVKNNPIKDATAGSSE